MKSIGVAAALLGYGVCDAFSPSQLNFLNAPSSPLSHSSLTKYNTPRLSPLLHLSSSSDTAEEEITIDQYSRCLSPYEEQSAIDKESTQYKIIDSRPAWQNTLLKPIKLTKKGISKVGRVSRKVIGVKKDVGGKKPGSLILMRCGESEWTKDGRFTGWADPDLVKEGVLKIEHAARYELYDMLFVCMLYAWCAHNII